MQLFGQFSVTISGIPLAPTRSRKGLHLLAYLALHANKAVDRERLAALFWIDSEPNVALGNLRRTLTDLRSVLGAQSHRISAPTPRTLRLDLSECESDLLAFDACRNSDNRSAWEQVCRIYCGALLNGWNEDWLDLERDIRREMFLESAEKWAKALILEGERHEALALLRFAISESLFRESLYALQMEALAAGGDYVEAGIVYQAWRRTLKDNFGNVEPGSEIASIHRRIREEANHKRTAAPTSFSAIQSSPIILSEEQITTPPWICPLTDLIGRSQEVIQIEIALQENRLATLVGPGGIGKTRLSLKVGERRLEATPKSAVFVALEALTEDRQVAAEALRALDLQHDVAQSPLDALIFALEKKNLLIVLDNCEHLLEASAKLANSLLTRCSGLRILATSRQSLGIPGEVVWQVNPLPIPEESASQVQLLDSPSVKLFLDRAKTTLPRFELTSQNSNSVLKICRYLDGIPLALELAAARIAFLSPEQILSRLQDSLSLLTKGSRAASSRQQTLEGLLEWSFQLLSEEEKLLFSRLSVFRNGWNLEQCEEICSQSGEEALDILDSLCEKSLVVVYEGETGTRKYRLLEVIRQFARSKRCDEPDRLATLNRLADWCVAFTEEAATGLKSPEQGLWMNILEEELGNIRVALEFCKERVDAGNSEFALFALKIGGAIWRFWSGRSHVAEGRAWLKWAIEHTDDLLDENRLSGLNSLGIMEWRMSDHVSAEKTWTQCLELSKQFHDDRMICNSLNNLGLLHWTNGDAAMARATYETCLALRRKMEDRADLAPTLSNLGLAALDLEDFQAAESAFAEAIAISKELGDRWAEAQAKQSLGSLHLKMGRYPDAKREGVESRRFMKELGYLDGEAISLDLLGNVARGSGDFNAAHLLLNESLEIRVQHSNPSGIVDALVSFATLAAEEGKWERSVLLWAAAEKLRSKNRMSASKSTQSYRISSLAPFKVSISPEKFEALWLKGEEHCQEEAVLFALEKCSESETL